MDGSRSLLGDSRASQTEWNEFFHSKAGLFKPNEAYRVSFDEKIIAQGDNTKFYALFRRAGQSDAEGWTEWQGQPGATGHVTLSIATRDAADYFLIIGVENRGAVSVNDLTIRTDPAHRPLVAGWPAPVRTWISPGGTAYYVDSQRGSDSHTGRSAAQAWRTLGRVNAGTFAPGDTILLRAGSRWTGCLDPGGSGAPGRPITLTRYGVGPKPRINAQGLFLATLYLANVEQWQVNSLDIANAGPAPQPGLTGVTVREQDFGVARHIVLNGLFVHDVTGSEVKADGGGSGISCTCGGSKVRSRFDGLFIEDCHLVRTDRNGITMGGNWARDATWFPSLRVVIRRNRLEDIGGDGIVPIACDGALIEHNVLRGGRMRAQDYAAGIWPWSCDHTVIQYNDVSSMRGTNDGEGYDSDYNCRDTLFQYNFSHDNDGGFMLICDDGGQRLPWNIGNQGTVIRYNVSVDDGLHTFHITGPCRDTAIYNNVFYIGRGRPVAVVSGDDWGGAWPTDTRFVNNIFYAAGAARFALGGMSGTVFDHNAFWGRFGSRPDDAHALLADPDLAAPGGMSASCYRPDPGSPCLRAGAGIAAPGRYGFGRTAIPTPPTIGAFQTP